jgi:hypothetical protein
MGIRLWQELHLGNQFQVQAKPLIQIVLPEWEGWRGTQFVFSSDKAPDCGRSGSVFPRGLGNLLIGDNPHFT